LGFERGPKPSAESFSATAIGPVAIIEPLERRLGRIRLDLMLAQAVECHLGFGQRASENRGTLDAATARDADRLRRASNPPAALEVRKAHLLLQDVALQLGDLTGKQRTGRQ